MAKRGMSGKFSREKGKRGEREAAKHLAMVIGCQARRGVQYAGGNDSPDVQHSISGLHIEVKRAERLNLYEALAQAWKDAPTTSAPIVLHRRNMTPWVVILELTSVPKLVESLVCHMMRQPGGPPRWLESIVRASCLTCATESTLDEREDTSATNQPQLNTVAHERSCAISEGDQTLTTCGKPKVLPGQ